MKKSAMRKSFNLYFLLLCFGVQTVYTILCLFFLVEHPLEVDVRAFVFF